MTNIGNCDYLLDSRFQMPFYYIRITGLWLCLIALWHFFQLVQQGLTPEMESFRDLAMRILSFWFEETRASFPSHSHRFAFFAPLWARDYLRPEPETLKTGILVLVPLPTFRGPTSQSKMSGYEIFPHPTSHFSFPISLIRSIAQNSWNILNTTVYGALGTSSNGPISHFMREVWCEKWEVGIVNAFIPFLTWHLRSGKWDSNEDSRF